MINKLFLVYSILILLPLNLYCMNVQHAPPAPHQIQYFQNLPPGQQLVAICCATCGAVGCCCACATFPCIAGGLIVATTVNNSIISCIGFGTFVAGFLNPVVSVPLAALGFSWYSAYDPDSTCCVTPPGYNAIT